MTLRSLAILVLATAVAVAAAILSSMSHEQGALADKGERLLPDLAASADEIAAITVIGKDDATTLSRSGDTFVDASGFPVSTEAVRDLLTSLSVLTIVENKTADPARYGDLDLAEPTAEEGGGTEIVLRDDAGEEIARIVAGRADYSVGGRGGGQYVRTGGSDVSHLVRGSVEVPLTRASWFDAVLLEKDKDQIEAVTLTLDNDQEIVFRRQDGMLAMVDQPADREIDAAKRDRLANLLSKLDFVDVRRSTAPDGEGRGVLRFETNDGLAITIVALSGQDQRDQWARISVESLSDEAKAAAEQLTRKVDGFEFRLPAGDLDVADWDADDFYVPPASN